MDEVMLERTLRMTTLSRMVDTIAASIVLMQLYSLHLVQRRISISSLQATVCLTNFFDRPSEEDGSISIRAGDEERGLRARCEERR
jgi:hypothetical protein